MADKPIKVDERTDRLVTDLAYFLRCSKKSIVRDAVAEFAETHLPRSTPDSRVPLEPPNPSDDRAVRPVAAVGCSYPPTFDALDPFDRLALRRRELLRQFAERGGTNVRVLDRLGESMASDESGTGRIVLLADTDPVDGSAAVPALEEVARHLLSAPATVVSMTALRMFGSDRLQRALEQSRPL